MQYLILALTLVVIDSQSWLDYESLSTLLADPLPEPVRTVVESA
jgi:hypothetical protein